MVVIREILEASRGIQPSILRCGVEVYLSIMRENTPRSIYDNRPLYGMEVVRDKYLPPDVWRLLDGDGTLLHDSRMRS
jgi:hypothetical protein